MTVPPWTEVQLAVGGALRLACGDRSGLGFFDTTVAGFRRSFRAAAICYPLYLLLLATHIAPAKWDQYGVPSILAVETIKYVIAWVAFPLVVLPVADLLDRGGRAFAFLTVYNWSQIPQFLLFTIIGLDGASGLLPLSAAQSIELVAFLGVLLYEWFVARVALGATAAQAALIVIIDQVLGTALDQTARVLY